jgi:hypothetical protein
VRPVRVTVIDVTLLVQVTIGVPPQAVTVEMQ